MEEAKAMAANPEIGGERRWARWGGLGRVVVWSGAAALLLTPLVAMQFTDQVQWTGFDFSVAAVMLALPLAVIEVAMRAPVSAAYRAGVAVALGAAVLLFWVVGAVGFLGDEDNPANLMFLGVLAVALSTAILGGFRAVAMARAMFATAAVQLLVGAVALAAGWASPGTAGLYEVVMGTSLFGGLWLLAGGLFRHAAFREARIGRLVIPEAP